jgi:quercetin dioxygenase-like cupin family protein
LKPTRLKPAFQDRRGAITDILDNVALNSVTLITSKKGVVRGNHFHKKTIQYLYLLSGKICYVTRRPNGKLSSYILKPGDLTASPPREVHTVVALMNSSFLVLSKGPRHGKNFEADTFRLI